MEIGSTNVRVPAGNRVGEEGGGFGLAQKWLGAGSRQAWGAGAGRSPSGASRWRPPMPSNARPSDARSPTGRAIQWKLADIFNELQAARLLVYQGGDPPRQSEDAAEDAYVCKYYADEMASAPPINACRFHAARAQPPICRSRSFGASSAATDHRRRQRGHEDGHARHVLKAYELRQAP